MKNKCKQKINLWRPYFKQFLLNSRISFESKNTRDMSSVLPNLILKTKSFIFSIESNVIYFESISFANNTGNVIFSVFSFLTKKYYDIYREKIFSLSCFNVLFAEDHVWFSIDKREIPSILITGNIIFQCMLWENHLLGTL